MTTIKLLSLLLLLISRNCYSQGNNTDSLLNKFRNDIQIEQREHSGMVVIDNETKESYYLLIINSSIKNLVQYTNDTNAVVRSYIFAGLLRKKVNKKVLLKILELHKNDTAKFTNKSADVVTSWTVQEFMHIGMILKSENKLPDIDYKKDIEKIRSQSVIKLKIDGISHGLIDKKQLLSIDSLALTNKELKVVSFTLFVGRQEMESSTSFLTDEMKQKIEKTVPGEFLFFDNIKMAGKMVW